MSTKSRRIKIMMELTVQLFTVGPQRDWTGQWPELVDPVTPNANWSCAQSSARRIIYLILIGCRRGALGRIVHELQVDVNTPAVIVIRDVFRIMLSVHFR